MQLHGYAKHNRRYTIIFFVFWGPFILKTIEIIRYGSQY